MRSTKSDTFVFLSRQENKWLIAAALYMDDILVTSPDKGLIENFLEKLTKFLK